MDVFKQLQERGFIEQVTNPEVESHLQEARHVYVGFDPTAESLHLGNLVALMGLAWFERCGHHAVALVGGATGMIGDPSWRSSERQLLDEATLKRNVTGISKSLALVLKKATVVNNYDWFGPMSCIEFLRDIGKHFRVGPMLGKENVRLRLQSEEGLSFTEFSYPLLQGYDFHHLLETKGVSVQMGGSDQWGNITAGIELIRKWTGKQAFGITFPLLVDKEGKKFGKSAQGAIWLDRDRLSPYHFYQYLINVADEDVEKLLKLLTFLDIAVIDEMMAKMKEPTYLPGTAQTLLAREVTRLIHGENGLSQAEETTALLSPGKRVTISKEDLCRLAKEGHAFTLPKETPRDILNVLVAAKLCESKGQARRLIQNGGLFLNEERISSDNVLVDDVALLAVGKKNKLLIQFEP